MSKGKDLVGWAAGVAVVVVDALSKFAARAAGVATENARGPFGLGPLWLTVLASIVVLTLILCRSRMTMPHAPWSVALVVGGGIANLFERLFFGRTTDFLPFLGGTFNLADVAILSGLVFLVFAKQKPPAG